MIRKRGFLLHLAAEGMAPVISDCASSLKTQRGIELFGTRIVERWLEWLRDLPPGLRLSAVSELADLPLAKTRAEAVSEIERLASTASVADRNTAVEYLAAIPRSAQRVLVLDPTTGGRTFPSANHVDNPLSLLNLLPLDVPPFSPGTLLPGTTFTLTDLAGASNLGVFYRAKTADSDALLLIKVCVDPSLTALLRQQPARQISGRWSEYLVRPLGQDLEAATPYFVFEHVPGGDLTMLLANLRHQTGRGLAADEVFRIIEQMIEGLAFAHALGMVHGDLKPANVLISGDSLKVADIGIGVAVVEQAIKRGGPGVGPVDQVNILRGSATWLYLSPERKRGEPSDPRHDLYSLGVLWYQLLVGDVTRALPENWAKELNLPASQRAILERCLGPLDERPRDGQALLSLLRPEMTATNVGEQHDSIVSPEEVRQERLRRQALLAGLKELRNTLDSQRERNQHTRLVTVGDLLLLLVLELVVEGYEVLSSQRYWMGIFPLLVVLAVIAGRAIWRRRQEVKTREELRGTGAEPFGRISR